MTKNEIYVQVVRLTSKLAETKVAKAIFDAASDGDAVRAQAIIDCFPVFYPELYKKIETFGKEFNKLVGDSEEDKKELSDILESCKVMMYSLAGTNIISQIAEATETEDFAKVQEIIDIFKKEHSGFVENLMNFQKEYNQYSDNLKTGHEGAIFGAEIDEENGVFVFDTKIIDALSFYALAIFANISDVYFFCSDGEGDLMASADVFYDAIEDATNEAFAVFVANYNLVDWVGEDEEYKTVGELLVAALADEFEESVYVEEEE